MQKLIFILNLVLIANYCCGQNDTLKNEVFIVGTIHTGNKKFDHKILYNVLKQYNPDIILWEQSGDYKRVFGLRTANFLKIWNPGIEQLSLQKYSRRNKHKKILPFDTSFASKRKYIKETTKMEERFFNSLNVANMTFSDSLGYADYANKRNYYYDFIVDADLISLNMPKVINMTRTLYDAEKNFILPLGKKYLADSLLVKIFDNDMTFWFARNDYMIKQIEAYLKQFAGKRIIILTGINHKYYLLDKLRGHESGTINIREIGNN